ncbi:TonB-dependent receptor [Comamonas sp. JC664]|uniref:TonB-dependent receptor domain-containing protein n=1 Tax=Comamonas sp. JC664 TaxID=2801917 RepID=UPI001E3F8D4A|nr:TonB-dependent receptor [Comamonas sp. JC664]
MSLIAQKQYEEGIAELEAAYAIKPHPNVLFNIARAYQDAGQPLAALDVYQRYLATNPPDAATVRPIVVALEQKLKDAEAQAAAPQQDTSALPMPPPPASVQTQQQLAALLERLERAVERAEAVPAGPAALPGLAPGGATPASGDDAASGADLGAVPYEERVVTASRRAQSSLEAPNATTVITAEDIRLSGATTLPELLRRVPGADVMALGVGSANVSLRGFNQRIANKVLVLVDGRTEYQDFLGLTIWSSIPIGLEEIERIEVIRGPGSALYGANAMLGVVNIITRAPGTGPRAQFTVTGGTGNTAAGSFVSHGASGGLRYRAAAGYSQTDKWSRDYDGGLPDITLRGPDPDLGARGARGSLSAEYTFAEGRKVGLSGGVNRFTTEIYPPGLLRNYFIDGLNAFAKGDVELGPLKLKTFWNHISSDAGPQYEPTGQRSLVTSLSSNLFNAELLFARDFELGGIHQLNVGVEGRLKRVAWGDYLGPLREQVHTAFFVQDDWRIVEPLSLVASYRVDRHPLLNLGRPGLAHSPRISALFKPLENHAFRASAASAFREPTFLESYTQLTVPVPGVNGASSLTTGNQQLRPERLTAFELGWRGEFPELGIDLDVAAYQNTVRDLIGLSAVRRLPPGQSYDPGTGSFLLGTSSFVNEDAIYTARGAEAGITLAPVDGLGLKLSASLQDITSDRESADECGPCNQAPQFRLYGGLTYRSRADLEFGVDAAYTSASTWIEREPAAADPTRIDLVSNPLRAYTVVNARVGYMAVKDTVTVALVGSHLGGAHSQHPLGNRIERRVYATLTVTP